MPKTMTISRHTLLIENFYSVYNLKGGDALNYSNSSFYNNNRESIGISNLIDI